MSKTKKLLASVMAVVLVMCTGYFALMSPTTAWSYQKSNISGAKNTFVFADFDVDGQYSLDSSIKFKGATAFADEDEPLFDSVVEVVDVEVTNDGGMPSRVYATVKNEYQSTGLHYFYYTEDMLVDSSIKETIKKELNGEMTVQALDKHNLGEDGNSGFYATLNPGETKTLKVALWIEYGESGIESAFNDSPWSTIDYRINITMTATQDVDGAMVR